MTAKKTKILFLNHVSEVSGAEQGLLNIIEALDPQRYVPVLVVPSRDRLSDIAARNNAQVVFIPLKRFKKTVNPFTLLLYVTNLLSCVARLVSLIRREDVRLLHSNSNSAHIYGAFAAKLARIPSIWHSRDLVNLGLLGKILWRLSSKIVAISNAVASHLQSYSSKGNHKLITIPNRIDTERFQAGTEADSVREHLGIPKDAFIIAIRACEPKIRP